MTARAKSASAGLLPVLGTYEDIRIGSLIQGNRATNDDVWEIIDQRNPDQFDYKTTPWFRAKNRATGVEVSIPPKSSTYPCTFMVPEIDVDPDEEKPKLDTSSIAPHAPLSDQDAVDLLVSELGARVVAWKDHETGIVRVPPDGLWKSQEYIDHLEVAHGMNLDAVTDRDIANLITLHGRAHADNWKSPRTPHGFPHQHDYQPSVKPFGDIK